MKTDIRKLKEWEWSIRYNFKRGKLSNSKIDKLKSIGFDFSHQYDNYVSYEECKKFARSLGIKHSNEWKKYVKSGSKPKYIPSCPWVVYKEWTNWYDFLEKSPRVAKSRPINPKYYLDHRGIKFVKFLSFKESRKIVRSLKLRGKKGWGEWKDRPWNIPSRPFEYYKKEWKGWVDYLGVDMREININQWVKS